MKTEEQVIKNIRNSLIIFLTALLLSGITAFPLQLEMKFIESQLPHLNNSFSGFLKQIIEAVNYNDEHYPFIAYGTDWLAFAHIVIAILFIGPYREPVKNKWVIEWGMICCILIFPIAFICGSIRHIPIYWQLIDCSFGVFGIIPLLFIRKLIAKLEFITNESFKIKSN